MLHVTHSALIDAAAATRATANRVEHERARLEDRAEGLLSSGWRGSAAADFAVAMREWDAGVVNVVRALEQMGALLDSTQRNFAATDADGATAIADAGTGL